MIERRSLHLVLGLSLWLAACGTPKAPPSPAPPPAPAVEAAKPAAPAIKERALQEQAFRVQELRVVEQQGQSSIRIEFSAPVEQYRHFTLGQPARIVLDVFGDVQKVARVESFRVDTHWVANLRLSAGDRYLRLVAEIAAASVPKYEVQHDEKGLTLIVGPPNPAAFAKRDMSLIREGKRADILSAEIRPLATETAAAVPAEKRYTGEKISFDFKDADIRNVFRLLAEISGLNIVVTDDVKKRVTVKLTDVPWDQALDLLIDTNGLGKEQIGNVVRISTAAQLKAEKDALAAAKKAEENLEPLQTVYLNVNYAKVKEIEPKIKPLLSPRGTVVFDERSSLLLVRDIRKSLEDVTALVSRLDTRTPQVLIESNLIETTKDFARALGSELDFTLGRGIDFDSRFLAGEPFTGSPTPSIPPTTIPLPTSGLRFGVFQQNFGPWRNLNAVLTAAENEGRVRIISRPSVVTLNNVASTIQSLRILRIQLPTSTNIATGTGAAAGAAVATEQVRVGIILTVTPQVSSDGFVLMNISVKSSTLGAQVQGSVVPEELSREAIANVLVRDGETVVIGGILKDTSETAEAGIPWLKDIPVLGWLFKRARWVKDFEELMVFITPRIIAGGSENLPTAEQLWREQLKKTEGAT